MRDSDLFVNIKKHIENNISELQSREIIIFPFGQAGILVKQILNEQYGIQENYIVDNRLSNYNNNILPLDVCMKCCSKNIIVIFTAEKNNNRELLSILREYVRDCDIINVIEPAVTDRPSKYAYFSELREMLSVRKVKTESEFIRIGRNNDGGYMMLNDFHDCKIAYSFGIGDDVSWDNDIAIQDTDVFQYDPTIHNIPYKNDRFHFYRIGISGVDDLSISMLTLETIIKNNGHENINNMILKMDVEGAEWECIESTSEKVFQRFDQIVFELHGLTDENNREKIVSSLKKINKTHQLVWIHGNNCVKAERAEDIIVPDCLEALYLSRQKYCFTPSNVSFPFELDQPNNDNLYDYELGKWGEE